MIHFCALRNWQKAGRHVFGEVDLYLNLIKILSKNSGRSWERFGQIGLDGWEYAAPNGCQQPTSKFTSLWGHSGDVEIGLILIN